MPPSYTSTVTAHYNATPPRRPPSPNSTGTAHSNDTRLHPSHTSTAVTACSDATTQRMLPTNSVTPSAATYHDPSPKLAQGESSPHTSLRPSPSKVTPLSTQLSNSPTKDSVSSLKNVCTGDCSSAINGDDLKLFLLKGTQSKNVSQLLNAHNKGKVAIEHNGKLIIDNECVSNLISNRFSVLRNSRKMVDNEELNLLLSNGME